MATTPQPPAVRVDLGSLEIRSDAEEDEDKDVDSNSRRAKKRKTTQQQGQQQSFIQNRLGQDKGNKDKSVIDLTVDDSPIRPPVSVSVSVGERQGKDEDDYEEKNTQVSANKGQKRTKTRGKGQGHPAHGPQGSIDRRSGEDNGVDEDGTEQQLSVSVSPSTSPLVQLGPSDGLALLISVAEQQSNEEAINPQPSTVVHLHSPLPSPFPVPVQSPFPHSNGFSHYQSSFLPHPYVPLFAHNVVLLLPYPPPPSPSAATSGRGLGDERDQGRGRSMIREGGDGSPLPRPMWPTRRRKQVRGQEERMKEREVSE
jgi:hypothetical protein